MISKLQVNAAKGIGIIDEVGSWNIASCLVVLNVFVWETYSLDYLSTAVRRPAPVYTTAPVQSTVRRGSRFPAHHGHPPCNRVETSVQRPLLRFS
jgi:hypothetical protein